MDANKNRSDEDFARNCSAALQTCFELLEHIAPFPGPWSRITPSSTCRQTVAYPDSFLELLRGAPADPHGSLVVAPHRLFADDLLRHINILVGAPDAEPHLNPALIGHGRGVFAVRDPSGEFIVDLLTPRGLLSGKPCGAYSVLVPSPFEPLLDGASVVGTISTREAALLLSLGFPVALMRHIRRSSALDFRDFWRPQWSAVPGCQALLNLSALHSQPVPAPAAAALSWGAQPEPTAPPDASRDGNPIDGPPPCSSATGAKADAVLDGVAVASEDQQTVAQAEGPAAGAPRQPCRSGEMPGVDLPQWRPPLGHPAYYLDCLMGGSLMGLSHSLPIQLKQTCVDLQEGLRYYHSENSLPLLLQLESADLEILQELLGQEHPLENIQEELSELLLVCRKPPAEVWPALAENDAGLAELATVAEAREQLLNVLAEATTLLPKQEAHDRFAAAVDREVVEPLRKVADAEHRALQRSVQVQYSEAVRNATIIEVYAVNESVPAQLRIDVPFDRNSPLGALAKERQRVLELSKLLHTLSKRH